jgi:pimeloyl-ACP methyl ester carboxylesterase
MYKMNTKCFLLVFLLIMVVTSCNGATQIAETHPSLAESLIDPHPCQIANYAATCGHLPVYENRTSQSGRIIDLNIAVIKATSSNPAPDPVFFLAGGPGEAATESTGNIQFITWVVNGQRDIVLVDQRGTGGSHQVFAPQSPDFSELSREELEVQFAAWLDQALEDLDMDPRFYTTSVAMDDLDAVRQALGYEEINLFGTSYGTTAAQYYLRQHEEHVRTVVLFAGSLLDVPLFERETENAQRTLDLAFDQCEADAACQKAYPDLRAEFATLLDRLDEQPVEVAVEGGSVILNRDYFAAKVEWLTRDTSRIAFLPFWIHQAYEKNDWTKFAEADNHGIGPTVMAHTIRCSEKWAAFPLDEVARGNTDSYLSGWSVGEAARTAMICKYLPHGETPEGLSLQPPSPKPVLLLNGEWDILNPPDHVAGAKELWQNSLSLVLPWQSHEISNMGVVSCMQPIVRDFIDRASVEGLDASCLQALPPPVFKTLQ